MKRDMMNGLVLCVAAALMVGAPCAAAQAEPTKETLKAQFKARSAELRDLKKRGQVGETVEGYVEAVDARSAEDSKIASLVSDENKDRAALYQLLADEINTENAKAPVKATRETVAVRNAHRNIEHAGPDEFLRVEKDHWLRVKDYPRFQKVSQLKSQGKVGETSAGLLEIVKDSDKSDATLAATVEEENASRTAEFKALAEKERVEVAAIAKRLAKRNFDNARVGDMVKDEGGGWRKK